MEIRNENIACLTGKLVSIKQVWVSETQLIYEGLLQINRDSGLSDFIPILFNAYDLNISKDMFVRIFGQFRSRDIPKEDGKLKVQLYVYVKQIEVLQEPHYSNNIELEGYVCKNPTLRNTPTGRQIADLLVACNYSKDKTAYIPVIAWGREARKSGKYAIGTAVKIIGRV